MSQLHIEQQITIKADPKRVFDALTESVANWWSKHFSESPTAITLEPHVGGRFYEEFGESGSGALYATVTFIERGKALSFSGPMGMPIPVINFIDFRLESQGDETLLKLSHRALGEVDKERAGNYKLGWDMLLNQGLKAFVETGATRKAVVGS